MNFAERLAYWYLRLNGFLPLMNFVLHRELHNTSDADLIAVRFPHVVEAIGGQPDDWDWQFGDWGFRLADDTIGLIVEVKPGNLRPDRELERRHWRVAGAVKRLGMFPEQEAEAVAAALEEQPMVRRGSFAIAKLLVGTVGTRGPWLYLSLEDATRFIEHRMEKYVDPKSRDRMFFGDDLIQFLAWRARSRNRRNASHGPHLL